MSQSRDGPERYGEAFRLLATPSKAMPLGRPEELLAVGEDLDQTQAQQP